MDDYQSLDQKFEKRPLDGSKYLNNCNNKIQNTTREQIFANNLKSSKIAVQPEQ